MAGSGLDSKHAIVPNKHNHERNEPLSGAIACRICDAIFMSDKALFDHVEFHFLTDEPAARKQLLLSHLSPYERSLLTNHFNQNPPSLSTQQPAAQQQQRFSTVDNGYASSLVPRERTLISLGTNTGNLDQQSLQTHPTVPYAVPRIIFVPQPRIDCFTRPFLNQLEASLLVEGMASIVDRELAASKLGYQETVDVTLKLGREEV
ncbi:hypothetical protein DITRI_Ditri15bG0100700 [Diplodiscus trichospermus]